MATVTLNLRVDEYTNRVLGVIKESFGLKDKSEALCKFAHLHGQKVLNEQITDEMERKLVASTNAHIKKYGFRKMSQEELDKLFNVK